MQPQFACAGLVKPDNKYMKFANRLRPALLALAGLFLVSCSTPRPEHVFIISIDGGKPATMQRSPMPVLNRLIREGACDWNAQTIFPPITLPAHTSMLTGVPMEQHGITWNDWQPTQGVVAVPTVFASAKAAGYSTALFPGKEKFRHLLQPGTVDEFDYDKSNAIIVLKSDNGDKVFKKEGCIASLVVATNAANHIIAHQPNLCFIHFADPDSVGHQFGWDSPEQVKSYAEVDAALGMVLAAIQQAGIAENSVVIVSSDHGGHGKGHGKNIPEDMTIPWIAWGQGVKKKFTITNAVNTCDTAATALWLLEAPPIRPMTGRPVTAAFE
jgi:predicted AlkP superfamily pyrophosphatase or phosphodiesterase